MKTDEYFMGLALEEAKKGFGRTSPNPCVGAVVVKDGCIISKGYHRKAGTPHAEVHALRRAGGYASGATIYVTLEPCNHTGRTPPCSHAIADSGIERVVVGMEDPNPLVDGSGIKYLEEHEIEVISGVLREECASINRPFIKHITTGTPLIAMKAGISLDGKINYQSGKSGWITGEEASLYTHRLRNTYDAILVGIETLLIDDPSLTTRLPEIEESVRDPLRIILDSKLRTPLSAKIFDLASASQTWIFCGHSVASDRIESLSAKGAKVIQVLENPSGQLNIPEVLRILGAESITSVLVEGGASIHGSMLMNRLVDTVHLFYGTLFSGDNGISLVKGYSVDCKDKAICLENINYKQLGNDMLIEGDVLYPV